ncbi:MAG: ABC transporter ATP-binding protein [Alphaproteobacteria bacterium]
MLSVQSLSKSFGDLNAVKNVSLELMPGEFFALLGPSGCGKSTFLRMLAGFDEPTSGDILLDGESLLGLPPEKRPLNMMFQSYALFPHMTVANNIAFGLKQAGVNRAVRDERIKQVMGQVQLQGLGSRKPAQLSGGQRQRVALARALVNRPKLLLLDEPLAALDKKLREETQFELVRLQQELGITFMVVTHDQDEAMSMADRLAVMNLGQIQQIGAPDDVYERPNSLFVADFLGTINVFDAGIIAEMRVGLRPEKIQVSKRGRGNLKGILKDEAYYGDVSTLLIELNNGQNVRVSRTNRHRDEAEVFEAGDKVVLKWDAGDVVELN